MVQHNRFDAMAMDDAINRAEVNEVIDLLDRGIDPNIRDIVGDTPLISAAWIGAPEIVELLLSRVANVHGMKTAKPHCKGFARAADIDTKVTKGHQALTCRWCRGVNRPSAARRVRQMLNIIAGLLLAVIVAPQALAADAPAPLSFLVGDWTGTGSGGPGQGAGTFSFSPDLQGHVLVRRAHSEYPATPHRAATVHDDLVIVYSDQSKAIYFDNEGHVIHYDISSDPTTNAITFLSTDPPPSPLFRLTYKAISPDEMDINFDIAMNGKAASFKNYLTGVARRVHTTKVGPNARNQRR